MTKRNDQDEKETTITETGNGSVLFFSTKLPDVKEFKRRTGLNSSNPPKDIKYEEVRKGSVFQSFRATVPKKYFRTPIHCFKVMKSPKPKVEKVEQSTESTEA